VSYTFGAGAGDDITFTMPFSLGADNTQQLIAFWFNANTLTIARSYWSIGSIANLEEDTPATDFSIHTDNTTDGQYFTDASPAIAVNEWVFCAVLLECETTGPVVARRCWVGRAEAAGSDPLKNELHEVSFLGVGTAAVGAFVGATTFTIGNRGSAGTVAFQGDIGWVAIIARTGVATSLSRPFPLATAAAPTTDEVDIVRKDMVEPLFRGRFPVTAFGPTPIATENVFACVIDLDTVNPVARILGSINSAALTISGATPSAQRSPVPCPNLPNFPALTPSSR